MTPPCPSLSVVIPCYNAERWIDATLRSVLQQGWPGPLEVLVVDDGSSDQSMACVQRWPAPVHLLTQPNAGVAAARNRGITAAQGDWVAFVDADDIWLPDKLQAQWAMLAQQPEARMAYSAWHVWHCLEPDPSPALVAELQAAATDAARWAGPSGWIYPELLLDAEVWTSTVIARRDLLGELGGFDMTLRIGEDLDLWLRASRITPILRVAAPLALYRMHPTSITKGAPDRNYQANVIESALRRWGYESPDGRRADPSRVDAALARTWRAFAEGNLVASQYDRACAGSRRALKHQPLSPANWRLAVECQLKALLTHRSES